jgi:hypothetical protein
MRNRNLMTAIGVVGVIMGLLVTCLAVLQQQGPIALEGLSSTLWAGAFALLTRIHDD